MPSFRKIKEALFIEPNQDFIDEFIRRRSNMNLGEKDFVITNGDRVAQGVISPVLDKVWGELNKVGTLNASNREKGGFGSTGIK